MKFNIDAAVLNLLCDLFTDMCAPYRGDAPAVDGARVLGTVLRIMADFATRYTVLGTGMPSLDDFHRETRIALAAGTISIDGVTEPAASDPLGSALLAGDADAAKAALDGGADPDKPVCGRLPLSLAASDECIKLLLDRGAKARAEDAAGVTPLECALFRRLKGGAALLLKAGADPYCDGGVLTAAADLDMLPVLKDAGVDFNRVDGGGCHIAADAFGRLGADACRRLLDAGAAIDPPGVARTLLHSAAFNDNREAVELLLERGVDPDVRDLEGRTALFDAVACPGAIEALLAAGANPNATDDDGATPLMEAVSDTRSTRMLLAAGADPNAADDDGMTPLHHLADEGGRACVAELLVKGGAALDARDGDGFTPLEAALESGNKELARFLRKAAKKQNR